MCMHNGQGSYALISVWIWMDQKLLEKKSNDCNCIKHNIVHRQGRSVDIFCRSVSHFPEAVYGIRCQNKMGFFESMDPTLAVESKKPSG